MKALIAASIISLCVCLALLYNEKQQSGRLSQQIEDYRNQLSNLLEEIEQNSAENIDLATQLSELRSDLLSRDGQIAALNRQLETAEQRIDPDYQQLESRIRQEIAREAASNSSSDPRVEILRKLGELDPMSMGELISLNAQYGEFLNSLDVDDDRLEVIVNALANMIADLNQARMEVVQQMQLDPSAANREDLRRQMQLLSNPEAQREALSYDLNDAELQAFAEFQEQQRGNMASFGVSSFVRSGDVIENEVIFSGDGQTGTIQLLSPPTVD